jgi:hypothetical protein
MCSARVASTETKAGARHESVGEAGDIRCEEVPETQRSRSADRLVVPFTISCGEFRRANMMDTKLASEKKDDAAAVAKNGFER